MLDELLEKNVIINDEFIKLSSYIRIKFNFRKIKDVFEYTSDIFNIIDTCNKFYKTSSYDKYKKLFANKKK